MDAEDTQPDPALSETQQALANELTGEDLELIDSVLFAQSGKFWMKLARVVASAMSELGGRYPGIPDVYYAGRIAFMVEQGRLESQGDLNRMRYCEIRRPA